MLSNFLQSRKAVASRSRLAVRLVAFLCLGFLAQAQTAHAQEPLTLFKNYFLTGDYTVRGKSLWRKGVNGKATVDIPPLGAGTDVVTPGADIVAAYLYIQTAEKVQGSGIDHARFAGIDLGPFYAPDQPTVAGSGTLAKALNWDQATVPCWSVLFPGGGRRLVTYRADVLRLLPIDPITKKQSLTTSFRVVVPDTGNLFSDDDENSRERADLTGPRAIGASLVVVYNDPATKPFKAIVLYDGGFTKRAFATMTQKIQGFYQSSTSAPKSARMTNIVGDGRPFLSEKVSLGTQSWVNPFASVDGTNWDNWTAAVALPDGVASATLTVAPNTILSDCLSWSAIVFSTTVQDTDGDGLLDVWEMDPPPLDVRDPAQLRLLPNLAQMGADPTRKDIFVEVGFLTAPDGTAYGGVVKPGHSHLPALEALTRVGQAFANAPEPIRIHFDVGGYYQSPASPYIIPADARGLARGGKSRSETLACIDATSGGIIDCVSGGVQHAIPGQYPLYPGTVGWKTGFRFLRDELLGFDATRKDIFRYVLFAHSIGMPKEPCLNADGTSNFACQDAPGTPQQPNLFHVPVTNSGIGDFPGGDLMVTLGAFDDDNKLPVGTAFMQAGTLLHEFGHTGWLTHAGPLPRTTNCNPSYLSSMNYLYQLRGLLDKDGAPQVDLSRSPGVTPGPDETALHDGTLGLATELPYRLGWYAPKATSYLKNQIGGAATKHCDGTDLSAAELADLNRADQMGGMVRVDAVSVSVPKIDWNADGSLVGSGLQDVDFSGGPLTALSAPKDDWGNIRFTQLGGRRNVGGYYTDALGRKAVGPLSLDVGRGDIGRGDIGRGDIGRGDIGRGDIGRGDIGRGGGDLDVGGPSPNEPVGDISLETAKAVEGDKPTPPSGLTACLTSDGQCMEGGGDRPVLLQWQAPHLSQASSYSVYRFDYVGEFAAPTPEKLAAATLVATFSGNPAYADASAPSGTQLAYFVRATVDGALGGISNFATVTTPSAPAFIDFEGVTAPAGGFTGIEPPRTIGIATFTGGQVLRLTDNLPADQTVVYGTAYFCPGCSPTMSIDFSQAVSHFSLLLMNGQTFTVVYTVQDNLGGTVTRTLVANSDSGADTVTLPEAGITHVQISGNAESWDFFIDNIQFTPM